MSADNSKFQMTITILESVQFQPESVVLLSNIVFELNPLGANRSPRCRKAHVLVCSYAVKETHNPQTA